MHETFHIDILVVLLIVAAAVAMTVKWIKLPYSIALVIVGLFSGIFHLLPPLEMSPELILLIFLPALLFEASWNIDLRILAKNWLPISVLAVPGVIISMAVVAGVLHVGAGIPLAVAFLFGAMISATDPISVVALFRKLGINERLTMILEGESLFNDGTAVVLFNLILAGIMAGTQPSIAAGTGSFIIIVTGGAAIGCALGFLASKITSFFDDHLLEITLTTILAYGSYLLAEQAHVSPVISVVVAGVIMGNFGSRNAMSASTRLAVNSFWEYAAFVVNSLVFLLIGLQIKLDLLQKYLIPIGIGIIAILIGRFVVVYGLSPLISSRQAPLPWKWRHLLFWGALRGSLCMALALSLPVALEYRELIIVTTFGVVLFTLLIPGLTIQPLVAMLKMRAEHSKIDDYKTLKAKLMLNQSSLAALQRMASEDALGKTSQEQLRADLLKEKEQLEAAIEELHLADTSIQELEIEITRRKLLELQKDYLISLSRQGAISDEAHRAVKLEIDEQLVNLKDEHH